MERRHPNIVNVEEVAAAEGPRKGRYRSDMRHVARAAGGRDIGCTLYEVPPGCAAFPHHWHSANEEALIVVSGEGTLRLGGEEHRVGAGDYVALLAGPEYAHQLRNTGTTPLRYYCLSTMRSPELAGYPDSKKVGVFARSGDKSIFRGVFREEDGRDYFDREPLADE